MLKLDLTTPHSQHRSLVVTRNLRIQARLATCALHETRQGIDGKAQSHRRTLSDRISRKDGASTRISDLWELGNLPREPGSSHYETILESFSGRTWRYLTGFLNETNSSSIEPKDSTRRGFQGIGKVTMIDLSMVLYHRRDIKISLGR